MTDIIQVMYAKFLKWVIAGDDVAGSIQVNFKWNVKQILYTLVVVTNFYEFELWINLNSELIWTDLINLT